MDNQRKIPNFENLSILFHLSTFVMNNIWQTTLLVIFSGIKDLIFIKTNKPAAYEIFTPQ
jgi:hypothetical protein